jgi:hypothetical protein
MEGARSALAAQQPEHAKAAQCIDCGNAVDLFGGAGT